MPSVDITLHFDKNETKQFLDDVAKELDKAMKNPEVRGLILKELLEKAKKGKPKRS